MCLLGGYLLGVVAGPDTPDLTTGVVESYDRNSLRLCLSGETVEEQEEVNEDGQLCGRWRRSAGATDPEVGQQFRYVTIRTSDAPEGEDAELSRQVLIYGDVVD